MSPLIPAAFSRPQPPTLGICLTLDSLYGIHSGSIFHHFGIVFHKMEVYESLNGFCYSIDTFWNSFGAVPPSAQLVKMCTAPKRL